MATRLTSTDASVQQLINRIQELEARRRMSMMHAKEAETRVAYASEEQTRLIGLLDALQERENILKQTLNMLSDEQRQLQLRTDASHLLLENAEKEEPLLLQAATASLEDSKRKCESWRAEQNNLNIIQNKWSQPSITTVSETSIADAEAELRLLLEEEQALISEAAAAAAATVGGVHNPNAKKSAETTTAASVKEEIDRLKHSLAEFDSQATRRKAIIGREMHELNAKVSELEQWISDSTSTVEELKSSIADMTVALQERRCSSCVCGAAIAH